MTGESGVCTFNWFCKNVAYGIHIGNCVDRFFVGTCCKILETGRLGGDQANTSSSSGKNQENKTHTETIKGIFQVESFGEVTPTTLRPTQETVDFPTFIKDNSKHSISSQIHNDKIFSFTTKHTETSSSLLNGKPVLPETFNTTNSPEGISFLNYKQTSNRYGATSSITVPERSTSSSPTGKRYPYVTKVPQRNSLTSNSSHEKMPSLKFSDENFLPQELFDKRNFTVFSDRNDSNSFPNHESQNDQWSVPIEKESHEISIVLEDSIKHVPQFEQSSPNEKIPGDTFFSWAYNFLNNRNKNTSDSEANAYPNAKMNSSTLSSVDVSSFLKPSHRPVLTSQYEVSTNSISSYSTVNKIDTAPISDDIFPHLVVNSVNKHKLFTNNTKLMEPQYPWPLPNTTSKEPLNGTIEKVTLRDVSRVCGRSRSSTTARIVGGRKAHYLRWPWMISLRRLEGKKFKHRCGAALLNQLWAITAAHCVDGKLPTDVVLRLGEYNLRQRDESHPHVERSIYMIVIHPKFDPATFENDLALMRFYRPVQLRANIVPVCLPKFSEDIDGKTAIVTGWGRLSETGELPELLHEVHMPILTNKECEELYYQAGYPETIEDVFVCAGLTKGGLDACEGDSGGPMVVKGDRGQYMLVGLISWGMGCAAPSQPGVYTRITKFVNWIDEIILY